MRGTTLRVHRMSSVGEQSIHEVDFCGPVASAANALFAQDPAAFLSAVARLEGFGKGPAKRKWAWLSRSASATVPIAASTRKRSSCFATGESLRVSRRVMNQVSPRNSHMSELCGRISNSGGWVGGMIDHGRAGRQPRRRNGLGGFARQRWFLLHSPGALGRARTERAVSEPAQSWAGSVARSEVVRGTVCGRVQENEGCQHVGFQSVF
jgi:hypothetical protein